MSVNPHAFEHIVINRDAFIEALDFDRNSAKIDSQHTSAFLGERLAGLGLTQTEIVQAAERAVFKGANTLTSLQLPTRAKIHLTAPGQ